MQVVTENWCVAWLLGLHKGHANQITSDQEHTARALRDQKPSLLPQVSSSFTSVSLAPVSLGF